MVVFIALLRSYDISYATTSVVNVTETAAILIGYCTFLKLFII